MSRLISIAAIFSVTSVLFSCVKYQEVTIESFNNVNLEKISPEGIFVDVNVTINNPNNYNIKVQAENLEVFVNGKLVGLAKFGKTIELKSQKTKNYEIPIKSSVPENGEIDLGTLTATALFGGAIDLQIKGDIVGKAKGIKKRVPIDIQRNIQL